MRSFVLLLTIAATVLGGERSLTFSLKGTVTTDTRFLYNIDRKNTFSEERYLSSNFGYGADIRWNILWERFYLGFSAEKIDAVEQSTVLYAPAGYIPVPYDEGFRLLSLEISGYYVVPISSEHLKFYLGGGVGTYDGDRIFSIARVPADMVASTSYLGIHVLTGIDYVLNPRFALRFEVKFRDPHFDVTTKFDQTSTEYLGKTIPLPQGENVTKINLYGVNYAGGLVITL